MCECTRVRGYVHGSYSLTGLLEAGLTRGRRAGAAGPPAAMADPGGKFDAVVIGSSERAFYGRTYVITE